MSSQNRIGIMLAVVVAISAMAVVLTHGSDAAPASTTGALNVQCAPTQRAVIHQPSAQQAGVTVECVDLQATEAALGTAPTGWAPGVVPSQAPSTGYTQPYPTQATAPVYASAPVAMVPAAAAPAVYYPAAPVASAAAPQPRPAQAPVRSSRVDDGPSTKERLLIIGGSAGAGAGIGALIGGKKGAGIGALIGGGGAAIVDQIKN